MAGVVALRIEVFGHILAIVASFLAIGIHPSFVEAKSWLLHHLWLTHHSRLLTIHGLLRWIAWLLHSHHWLLHTWHSHLLRRHTARHRLLHAWHLSSHHLLLGLSGVTCSIDIL